MFDFEDDSYMSFEDALKILNLKRGYTKEELKKAYRTGVKKYHSDNFHENKVNEEAEKMMRKINRAKEILDNYLKDNKETRYEESESEEEYRTLLKYKKEVCDELISSVGNTSNIDLNRLLDDYILEIVKCTTKMKIDILKKDFYRKKREIFEKREKAYRKSNKIYYDFIFDINYDCTWVEFEYQLSKMKETFINQREARKENFKKALEEKIEAAKNFAGFKDVEAEIQREKELYRDAAIEDFENGIDEFDSITLIFENRILEIFKYYFKNYKRYEEVKIRTECLNDEGINNSLKELYNNLYEDEFDYLYEDIIFFLDKKDASIAFDNINGYILKSATDKIYKLKIASDYSKIIRIYAMLEQILLLLKLGSIRVIDIDDVSPLYYVTFENLDADQLIIDKIIEKINIIRIDSIFINIEDSSLEPFYYLDYDEEFKSLHLSGIDLSSMCERLKYMEVTKLEENYLSLNQFLLRAKYIGQSGKSIYSKSKKYYILYKWKDMYLAYDEFHEMFSWLKADSIEVGVGNRTKNEKIFFRRCEEEKDFIENLIINYLTNLKRTIDEMVDKNYNNDDESPSSKNKKKTRV